MGSRTALLSAGLLALLLATAPALAVEGRWEVEVPAGQWKSIRLRNVPVGAVVAVDVEMNGPLTVLMVSDDDYRRFPGVRRPLFTGDGETRIAFTVTVTSPGTYFVVFDNRAGQEARTVEIGLRGSRPTARGTAQATLDRFQRDLQRVFVFKPFPIRVGRCGVAQAFATSEGIVFCLEYAQKLHDTLADKAKAADAMLFTLFHELGHVLLAQWGYPFYANEEVADEFATAAMIMLGQQHRLRAKAEFFAANPSVAEAIAKLHRDDRHPISAQRARNILRWMNDPTLVRRWQPLFVPHMQTTILEQLRRRPPTWADPALIDKELVARKPTGG